MTTFVTTSLHVDATRFGQSIPAGQRETVERLRRQAFALQHNFNRAEDSAHLLQAMLESGARTVEAAIDNTYEGHAVRVLRLQLFRLMIVDLHASILDHANGNSSLKTIMKELRKAPTVPAIQAYYSDTAAFSAEVTGIADPSEAAARRVAEITEAADSHRRVIANQWAELQATAVVLDGVEAKRLTWARHNAIAHLAKSDRGLASLNDIPPYGSGPFQLDEPLRFLQQVRSFAYEVFELVTMNRWANGGVAAMYARAFWDRFKNGQTEVGPGPSKPLSDSDSPGSA